MDPRRILIDIKGERQDIAGWIAMIPGVREVIWQAEDAADLPGIRVLDPEAAAEATLIITEPGGEHLRDPIDLLIIPSDLKEGERLITDRPLLCVFSERGAADAAATFLDQQYPPEIILLAERGSDQEIRLHAPHASITSEMMTGDLTIDILRLAAAYDPTLIVLPKRIPDPAAILKAGVPVFIPYLRGGAAEVREIRSDEFPAADTVWIDYHGTTGDPAVDRIFAAFEGDAIVSLARCRRHPDGYEVDAVFTPESHRGRGLSRQVMTALIEACYNDELTMYAVVHLKKFYGEFGFVPIPEGDLPASVRERYLWAAGNMEGAEVAPMRRSPQRPAILQESISINR